MKWMAVAVAVILSSGTAIGARPTAAACRAACVARNVPASCAWLSRNPAGCVRDAIRACRTRDDAGGTTQCPLPNDLPACLDHHGCPFGSRCVDATCQVVGCGGQGGVANCTGDNRCAGDRCVVGDCRAASSNCAAGFHCAPAAPPFDAVSGTCVPNVPGETYCTGAADCIAPGNFNPTCVQGICTRRARRLGSCQTGADCARWCGRGNGAARPGRCGAAGMCLCPSCVDDAQCAGLLACPAGRPARCLRSGTCACRQRPRTSSTAPSTSTTATATTTTATVVTTTVTATTTTTQDTTCCCTFQIGDLTWHCVQATVPGALCAVPWPECCTQDSTVCD